MISKAQFIIVGDTISPTVYYNRINAYVPPAAWSTNTLSLDIDGDNVKDFLFSDSHSQSPSHHFESYDCQPLNGFEINAYALDSTVIDTMVAGMMVDNSLNWKKSALILYSYSQLVMNPTITKGLFLGKRQYLGFRKKTATDTIYGWFYVSDLYGIPIISYAFERNCSQPIPMAINSTSSIICSSESATLSVSGANSYTWSTGNNDSSIVVTPTVTTKYIVVGSGNMKCPVKSTFTLNVNSTPTINISTSNSLICVGENSTLTVNGASSYTWSTGSNSTTIAISPTTTTSYSVSGSYTNGCNSSALITQTVNACIGINELRAQQGISLYPNPASNILNISSKEFIDPNDYVEIKNTLGQAVFRSEFKKELDISTFPNGCYYIQVQTKDQQYNSKFIKEQRSY